MNWSRIERRFNGTWRAGEDRFGDISVRLVGNELRGAYTNDPKSRINAETPRLADLIWTSVDRQAGKDDKAAVTAKPAAFLHDPLQLTFGAFDVRSLSFSANDQFLAAGGGGWWSDHNPGFGRIWDFKRAKEVASYPAGRGVATVNLSPDGRRIALCSWSGDISLREVGGAELMHDRFGSYVRAALSPDGKLLVGVTEREQLRTWDGVTGRLLEKANDAQGRPLVKTDGAFRGATFQFHWVGFSPDGKYLVACGGKKNEVGGTKFAVWSVASRQQLYRMGANADRIVSASISPDSQTLATSGETSVTLWDLATGVRRTETEDTGGTVDRVAFSPDGSLLASTSLGASDVTLWDPSTGQAVGVITGHRGMIHAMAFTRDGKNLVTGGSDRTIRIWDVATRQQTAMLQEPRGTATADTELAAIVAVACSPDGTAVAAAREDGPVDVYRPSPAGLSSSWIAHVNGTAALAYTPDGKTLATGGYDDTVKIWNPATGELIRTFQGHTGWVFSLACSHDGQILASGGRDRSIRLWNRADGRERLSLSGHAGSIRSLAFSHDDKLIASAGADETVRLWDVATGHELAVLNGHKGTVRSVAFADDDRLLASGGEDQIIRIWNVDSHDLRGTLSGHTAVVSAVAFVQQTLVSAVGTTHFEPGMPTLCSNALSSRWDRARSWRWQSPRMAVTC